MIKIFRAYGTVESAKLLKDIEDSKAWAVLSTSTDKKTGLCKIRCADRWFYDDLSPENKLKVIRCEPLNPVKGHQVCANLRYDAMRAP